jgi:hypothetical protein
VLDNIEANAGRDMNKVLDVYRQALQEYLQQHPELNIKKLHVGTGYTDVGLGHLEEAEAVPRLSDNVYTDAHVQKLLFSV